MLVVGCGVYVAWVSSTRQKSTSQDLENASTLIIHISHFTFWFWDWKFSHFCLLSNWILITGGAKPLEVSVELRSGDFCWIHQFPRSCGKLISKFAIVISPGTKVIKLSKFETAFVNTFCPVKSYHKSKLFHETELGYKWYQIAGPFPAMSWYHKFQSFGSTSIEKECFLERFSH